LTLAAGKTFGPPGRRTFRQIRNRKFADSLLEESGFELPVPFDRAMAIALKLGYPGIA
jgi:hypothetical protein